MKSSMALSRFAVTLFGCAVAWMMGVKTPRAQQFSEIEFAGAGRATLVVEDLRPPRDEGEATPRPLEVYSKLVFGTELSFYEQGLYIRTRFRLPRTGEELAFVVDLDRSRQRKSWNADDDAMRARLYAIPPEGETSRQLDADAASGSLELEAAIVGRTAAGFRLRGWLELVDPGPDRALDTDDDLRFEVELKLESLPTPEEIVGQPAPPPSYPVGGYCDPIWCWEDDYYYDPYPYSYGCTDAEVGYETSSDGCDTPPPDDSDTIIDDGYVPPPDEEIVTDGCSDSSTAPEDDPGCEGSDGGDLSSDGCDGEDVSGCSDSGGADGCAESSGGASGCGSSGCEGDTFQRPTEGDGQLLEGALLPSGQSREGTGRASVSWVAGLFLLAALIAQRAAARQGRRDRRRGAEADG